MRGKFAHISDCHIGAWRDPKLREINDGAFAKAIDLSIENQVDFVVISGDIFDVGLPEMSSVRSAVRKLKELDRHDISTYVVYGSHDYSPTTVSLVDVLTSAGLFVNVGDFDLQEKAGISLKSIVDEKTGAGITGLPARKGGLEKEFYEKLTPKASRQNEERYSIFVFHASVNEMQSMNIPIEQSLSIVELPKGYSYYAGGHVHKRATSYLDESPVVYPGPLFGTSYVDLELCAKGEKRGFVLVEFEDSKTVGVNYVDIPTPRILARYFSAEGKNAEDVEGEIRQFAQREKSRVLDAIVLLKIRGMLSSGKSSDIDWPSLRASLLECGAHVVNINRIGLSSPASKKMIKLGTASKEEIEQKLLHQHINEFKSNVPELSRLSSGEGVSTALKLLRALKTEKKNDETKQSFENRILKEGSQILGLEIEGA